jgi:predicted RNase H-like nuclease
VFAGVDGCKGGWVVVTSDEKGRHLEGAVVGTFAEVLTHCADAHLIAVDMPIGLPEQVEHGGREADRLARKLLSPLRGSSVFPCPARRSVDARSYAEALQINRACSVDDPIGLSAQCFKLFGKMREVDECLDPGLQDRVMESHPEVAFLSLNDGRPMPNRKRSKAGQEERRLALDSVGFDTTLLETEIPRRLAQIDDILDAAVLCWLAGRIHRGEARRVPQEPPVDARGLRMEIWY